MMSFVSRQKKTSKTFTPEVKGEIRETRSCFNVMQESDKPEKKQLKMVLPPFYHLYMIYDDNPITLILNTPEMVPIMWKFPTKPWFLRGCLILGWRDYCWG